MTTWCAWPLSVSTLVWTGCPQLQRGCCSGGSHFTVFLVILAASLLFRISCFPSFSLPHYFLLLLFIVSEEGFTGNNFLKLSKSEGTVNTIVNTSYLNDNFPKYIILMWKLFPLEVRWHWCITFYSPVFLLLISDSWSCVTSSPSFLISVFVLFG